MKRFAILMLTVAMFAGCADLQRMYPVNPAVDVCLTKPAETPSFLCEAAGRAGLSLNTVDTLLLDASAVGVIMSRTEIAAVSRFLTKIEGYLQTGGGSITYIVLIEKMEIDAAEAIILKNIIARHIAVFRLPQVITPYDIELVKTHIKHQRAQFGLL